MNIILIATFDSFLNQGLYLAKALNLEKIDVYIRLSQENQLSLRQLKNAYQIYPFKLHYFYLNEFDKINLNDVDWVILSGGNHFCYSFLDLIKKQNLSNKIKTICIPAGVIFGDENFINSRLQSDLLLLPSLYDVNIAQKLKQQHHSYCQIIHFGLPSYHKLTFSSPINQIQKIVYFDQITQPEHYYERCKLYTRLCQLAQTYPQKEFLIKQRIIEKERTIFNQTYPLNHFTKNYAPPSNLKFIDGNTENILSTADIVLGLTSTAVFEAINQEKKARFIADFGIQQCYKNQFIANSGLFTKINKIFIDEMSLDSNYKRKMITFPNNRIEILKGEINNFTSPFKNKKIKINSQLRIIKIKRLKILFYFYLLIKKFNKQI